MKISRRRLFGLFGGAAFARAIPAVAPATAEASPLLAGPALQPATGAYPYVAYSLGFLITREAMEDDLYLPIRGAGQ